MSGPIVAMVWTGLNIVPMVRSMVGATKPSDAAPGSIRGDFCIDVGRNLIHASDSSEAAQKEVAMWFTNEEICQWRPCSLEWTYEDEVVAEEKQKIPEVLRQILFGKCLNFLILSLMTLIPTLPREQKYETILIT